jgi:tetratricopeptide (TPR) repeat protein
MSCPDRGELLDRVLAGEDVPHLRECDDCADYVEGFRHLCKAFDCEEQFDAAFAKVIDETLEDVPSKEWAAVLVSDRRFHHSIIIEELLRRADRAYENPSVAVDVTAAAVALCDAMEKASTPMPPRLVFDAWKERSAALRAAGDLDGALDALARAGAVTAELAEREHLEAVIWLCTALIYTEADLGRFDEAIALAESAEEVLARCGDRRRALMAQQAKAHALACMWQFRAALQVALPVAAEYDAMGASFDAANAHHLVAHCYVETGIYDEAMGHALVAQCGYEKVGNAVLVARVSHVVARVTAALGRFEQARAQFDESAEVVFVAGVYDVWVLMRLDYVAAAMHHDPLADVRGDVEAIARVCFMLGRENSTMRRRYAAEALTYLRQLAKRDELTPKAADYVRDFVTLNASRPPLPFRPPAAELVM